MIPPEKVAVGYGYPVGSSNYSVLFFNRAPNEHESSIVVPNSTNADSYNEDRMREAYGVLFGNALGEAMQFTETQKYGVKELTVGIGYDHSEQMGLYAASVVIPRPDIRRGLYYSFTAVERADSTPEVHRRLSSGESLSDNGLNRELYDLFGGYRFLIGTMPSAAAYDSARVFDSAVNLSQPASS